MLGDAFSQDDEERVEERAATSEDVDDAQMDSLQDLGDDPELDDEFEDVDESPESVESLDDGSQPTLVDGAKTKKKKHKKIVRRDAPEQRLLGRRAMCRSVEELVPNMLKTVKLRILGSFLDSTRGVDDQQLSQRLIEIAPKITAEDRIVSRMGAIDPDVNRRTLKDIILNVILLQEETYSLEETRLDAKVREYEETVLKAAETLDYFDAKKHDATRVQYCETYRIVLEAAWRNNNDVSFDEEALLQVLRERLGISTEDHRLISAYINRFPKLNGVIHTNDEIHDARKLLQREGVLWSYRDENNRNIDIIPKEVASILRTRTTRIQLQRTNFRRLLEHDAIRITELRELLIQRGMDRYGVKSELIERLVGSDILPTDVLNSLDRVKLSDICRIVGLKSSGTKQELVDRVVDFYDDLSFVERETQDVREEWYNNYELLAARGYSDLRAKKLIQKDLEIEHQFERATDFLFESKLNITIDVKRSISKADGRIPLMDRQVLLWDCKSAETPVNLQDFLEGQFDSYFRKEREKGFQPLAILVIAHAFTPQSVKLAHQYKAKTNWDVALILADALKHLAELWAATGTEQPFPMGLFNRTEIIDTSRAEFLLSLA